MVLNSSFTLSKRPWSLSKFAHSTRKTFFYTEVFWFRCVFSQSLAHLVSDSLTDILADHSTTCPTPVQKNNKILNISKSKLQFSLSCRLWKFKNDYCVIIQTYCLILLLTAFCPFLPWFYVWLSHFPYFSICCSIFIYFKPMVRDEDQDPVIFGLPDPVSFIYRIWFLPVTADIFYIYIFLYFNILCPYNIYIFFKLRSDPVPGFFSAVPDPGENYGSSTLPMDKRRIE